MTVAELIEQLREMPGEMPGEMEVFCSADCVMWVPVPEIQDIAKNKDDSWDNYLGIFQTMYPDEWLDTKKAVIL